MRGLLISVDVGGTLATTEGPSIPALLVKASPLEERTARLIVRHYLHTAPQITQTVITQVCAALKVPDSTFPRDHQAAVCLIPGAQAAVRRLSSHGTVVTLSNVTCLEAGIVQLRTAFDPWISGYYPSSRIGHAKPTPEAFRAVARACGGETANLVHIGDDWECDIVGAVAAGARAIWISRNRPVPELNVTG